jgi:hypothetical protein
MSEVKPDTFKLLYSHFDAPITSIDCGTKCAPYNTYGVPFCCDIHHAVPTAYQAEWRYLKNHTDLWRIWEDNQVETIRLREIVPDQQELIVCLGHDLCQRDYRSITCRAFPFFPYLDSNGEFIGFSYYWQYEDRCWIISNLDRITPKYWSQFIAAYDWILEHLREEKDNFFYHSRIMRKVYGRKRRSITLMHRSGNYYKISPSNERKRRIHPESLQKFGSYKIAAAMPFPDEI